MNLQSCVPTKKLEEVSSEFNCTNTMFLHLMNRFNTLISKQIVQMQVMRKHWKSLTVISLLRSHWITFWSSLLSSNDFVNRSLIFILQTWIVYVHIGLIDKFLSAIIWLISVRTKSGVAFEQYANFTVQNWLKLKQNQSVCFFELMIKWNSKIIKMRKTRENY